MSMARMSNPKYTIHIPVYNVEKFLHRCVDSLLSQTIPDFEIILTDDGSTDSSGRICDEYANKDHRIRVFHNANQGLLLTRRFSIARARGEYSLFIDSDDYVESNYLEIIDEILTREQCDVMVFNLTKVSQTGKRQKNVPIWDKEVVFISAEEKLMFYETFLFNPALNSMARKAIKTELLKKDKTPYEEYSKVTNAEDALQSFYPMFNAEKVVYTPVSIYNYYCNDSSMTRSFNPYRYKSIFDVREKSLEYLPLIKNKKIYDKYANYCIGILCSILYEISLSGVSTADKVNIMYEMQKHRFYSDFITKNVNVNRLSKKYGVIYLLFREKRFRVLLSTFRLAVLLKNIKDRFEWITKSR